MVLLVLFSSFGPALVCVLLARRRGLERRLIPFIRLVLICSQSERVRVGEREKERARERARETDRQKETVEHMGRRRHFRLPSCRFLPDSLLMISFAPLSCLPRFDLRQHCSCSIAASFATISRKKNLARMEGDKNKCVRVSERQQV